MRELPPRRDQRRAPERLRETDRRDGGMGMNQVRQERGAQIAARRVAADDDVLRRDTGGSDEVLQAAGRLLELGRVLCSRGGEGVGEQDNGGVGGEDVLHAPEELELHVRGIDVGAAWREKHLVAALFAFISRFRCVLTVIEDEDVLGVLFPHEPVGFRAMGQLRAFWGKAFILCECEVGFVGWGEDGALGFLAFANVDKPELPKANVLFLPRCSPQAVASKYCVNDMPIETPVPLGPPKRSRKERQESDPSYNGIRQQKWSSVIMRAGAT